MWVVHVLPMFLRPFTTTSSGALAFFPFFAFLLGAAWGKVRYAVAAETASNTTAPLKTMARVEGRVGDDMVLEKRAKQDWHSRCHRSFHTTSTASILNASPDGMGGWRGVRVMKGVKW